MVFEDWKEKAYNEISPNLLWDYNLETFDWENIKNRLLEMVDNRTKIFEKLPQNVGLKNNKKM